jgi:hypothetical protein
MRMNVMNTAHRRAALIAADVTRETVGVATDAMHGERRRAVPRRWYRPAAAFMAAALTLALMAGTVYGAKAGGPFYAARIWIEAANLPIDLAARAEAEGIRLDARIAEAQQASADGDAPAAEAALAAYSEIVLEAVLGAAGDPTADSTIEISITRHVLVLTQLAGTVPPHARVAIQDALVASSRAIQDLDGQMAPGDDRHAGGPDSLGGAAAPGATESTPPGQGAGAGPGAGGDGIAAPGETAAPDKTPPARDHDAPPPGQSRGGVRNGAKEPTHPAHASPGPSDSQSESAPAGKPEEPSAS